MPEFLDVLWVYSTVVGQRLSYQTLSYLLNFHHFFDEAHWKPEDLPFQSVQAVYSWFILYIKWAPCEDRNRNFKVGCVFRMVIWPEWGSIETTTKRITHPTLSKAFYRIQISTQISKQPPYVFMKTFHQPFLRYFKAREQNGVMLWLTSSFIEPLSITINPC